MITPLVCDISGVLAALDSVDPDHGARAAVLSSHRGPLLLSPLVLAELDHLLKTRLGAAAAQMFAHDVGHGAWALEPLSTADVLDCLRVDRRYIDRGLNLADASLVVIAARADTTTLLSLDHRHFRAVHPLQGEAFTLWPADY